MLHLNSVSLGVANLYEAAFRLRAETGLGFYDGGWNPPFLGNKIFPLGAGVYIQMTALVDAHAVDDAKTPQAAAFAALTAAGDIFRGLALRVDSEQELAEIAGRHGLKPTRNPNAGRIQSDGSHIGVSILGSAGSQFKGYPDVYLFDEPWAHPSGRPVEPAPGLVQPHGVSWLEYGGSAQAMTDWIGPAAAALPIRYVDGPVGVRAFAVATERGEIVVRRRPQPVAS